MSSFDFQVDRTDRTVQYKLNAQSLRLFGLHRDVNDAHRASANRLQNKQSNHDIAQTSANRTPAPHQTLRLATVPLAVCSGRLTLAESMKRQLNKYKSNNATPLADSESQTCTTSINANSPYMTSEGTTEHEPPMDREPLRTLDWPHPPRYTQRRPPHSDADGFAGGSTTRWHKTKFSGGANISPFGTQGHQQKKLEEDRRKLRLTTAVVRPHGPRRLRSHGRLDENPCSFQHMYPTLY